MSNIPKIRFKGFTDAWEQRKLGEIATYRNGKAHEANQLDVGTYELVNLNSISIDGGLKPSGKFIEDGSDTLQRNDLVMVLSDVGHGDLLGRVAIIPENNRYVLNQRVALLRINDDTNTYFLFSIINRYQDYFKKLGAGSSQLNISRGIVENFEVAYPNVAEQRMIADYFQSLDHLITLHQRKCDNMKKIKKFMLQKMFPKKGEKFPEIRFEGFTDAWEQRKLGETCSRVQGNDGRMELPTLTISAANGWMKQEDRFSGNIAGKEQKNYTLLHKGELSYNHGNSKLAKYGTVFSLQTYEEALVPRVYHSFKVESGSADFIEYYFATKMPDRELRKLISSGARMDGLLNIGYDDFMGIKMMFPSTLEQDKIAEYFRALDYLITLHQRKSDELKEMKKYMLQNMFPDGRK